MGSKIRSGATREAIAHALFEEITASSSSIARQGEIE
jgi:hypothetical protein